MPAIPWWVAGMVANGAIIATEYVNHTNPYGTWMTTLLRTAPLIFVAQWSLYYAFSGAPSWMVAWAMFTVGNSVMRIAAVSFTGGSITSYTHVLLGVAVMIAGSMAIKEGLAK